MASIPTGNGYWVINSLTGAIYRYGLAGNYGEPRTKFAHTSPEFVPVMRQIVSTPTGKGYWVYEVGLSDMGVVDHYGDAGFFGDTLTLVRQRRVAAYNGRPVGMARTADGKGYWEVYSDGGVFAFGKPRASSDRWPVTRWPRRSSASAPRPPGRVTCSRRPTAGSLRSATHVSRAR